MNMRRILAVLLVALAATGCTSPTETSQPGGNGPANSGALNDMLLTEADLPSGYANTPLPSLGAGTTSVEGCPALTVKPAGNASEASVAFAGGAIGSFITETLRSVSDAEAGKALDELAGATKSCAKFEAQTMGIKVEFTTSEAGLPALGDRTVAVRLAAQAAGLGVVVDEYLVAVKQGPLLIVIAVVGPGQVDKAVVEAVVRKAWEKTKA